MIKLYACLGSGNCFKPWLALKQLGKPFSLRLVDVLKGEHKSSGYLEINPIGVVPFMLTETGCGIGESNAMLWYLAEDTRLMPQTPLDRAIALQWMFFEQTKLEPFISPARFFTTILPEKQADKANDIARWQEAAVPGLLRLDAHLARKEFMLSSGYCVADIAVFGYVHLLDEAGMTLDAYPSINRWVMDVSRVEGFRPLRDLGQTESKAA